MQDAVERATVLIRERYAEPLTLADLAEAAIMSRFHFSRLFRQTTGISPGRFLTAVRLHEAKRLLLTTSISVADISCMVGYTSLGTFTTRFTECVGVSPGKFRRLAETGLLDPVQPPPLTKQPAGSLTGTLRVERGLSSGPIFMGIFDRPIPQGKPDACLTVPALGDWLMDPVPEGVWYVMAVTLHHPQAHFPHPATLEHPILVGSSGPVRIRLGGLCNVDLTLHALRPTDPPILLTLPSLLNLPTRDSDDVREASKAEEDEAVRLGP
jgi:AraC family transcriptional regulator